jgi:prepilin-type processing-associated H-X9-DG protein
MSPLLARAREQAHRSTCLSNLHQIGRAHLIYLQDWDEKIPDWWQLATQRPEPFGWFRFWPEYLQPYLRTPAVLRDASAVWQEQPAEFRLADYALLTGGPGGRGTREKPHWRWAGPPLCLAAVARPAETIGFMDGWTTPKWTQGGILRHIGGINCSFLDGHVRWLSDSERSRVDTDGRGFYWLRYAAADR